MDQDPAPALTRGIELLRILEREGRCSLEQLVAASGFPKTSVLRLLTSLELAGAVVRDPASKRYRGLLRLAPTASGGSSLRDAVAERLPVLAEAVGATAELYAWDRTMVMVDRCAPEGADVQITARVGYARDLTELDALGQIACVWGGNHPGPKPWGNDAGKRKRLTKAAVAELLSAAERDGIARDTDLNSQGVLRLAAPLVGIGGALLGALAVARTWVPDPAAADRRIAGALRAAIASITPTLAS